MSQQRVQSPSRTEPDRLRLALTVIAVVAGLFLVWKAIHALLLLFAGLLFAVFLTALSELLGRVLPWKPWLRLTIVTVLLFGLVLGLLTWGGTMLATQVSALAETVNEQVNRVLEWLEARGVPRPEISPDSAGAPPQTPNQGATRAGDIGASSLLPAPSGLFGQAQAAISALFGALSNLLVIVFIGLLVAAQPLAYRDGLVRLLPPASRANGREVLNDMGATLRNWLLAQGFVMLVIAVATWLGLALAGITPALILGAQAGLLAFIPNIGPVIAGIPIILAGLAEGISSAVWAIGIYLMVQLLESYLLTPLVQRRAIRVPPAVIFAGQVLLGVLFGLIGLALALPLMAVGKVALEHFYIGRTLGEGRRSATTR
jgi:predicted PurR-regulated permease PerM